MSDTIIHQPKSLTRTQVREIRAELTRQSRRFAPDDPRAHAYATALDRLERGTYGTCATCGNRIPHERLAVMPETVYCVSCRRDHS